MQESVQDKVIIKFRCKDPGQDISKRDGENTVNFSKRSHMIMNINIPPVMWEGIELYLIQKKREKKKHTNGTAGWLTKIDI